MNINYTPRKNTDYIGVHSSATYARMTHVDEHWIRAEHMRKGWIDVGYNIVIPRSGVIEIGRPLDYQGAHVAGFNHNSLGICMAGGLGDDGKPEDNFLPVQKDALLIALRFCKCYAPRAIIKGHRDFPSTATACPSFDVRGWLERVAPELL